MKKYGKQDINYGYIWNTATVTGELSMAVWLTNSFLPSEQQVTKRNDLCIQKGADSSGLVGWKCCRKPWYPYYLASSPQLK